MVGRCDLDMSSLSIIVEKFSHHITKWFANPLRYTTFDKYFKELSLREMNTDSNNIFQ